jgi:hypothetical protein
MEGYKDPFNRRTYPWGREDLELLSHFRCLGKLRRDFTPLRLGDIHFFEAEDKRLGFSRTHENKTVKIYVNRSGDPWQIDPGKVVFGHNLQTLADDCLVLAPRGFCLVEM